MRGKTYTLSENGFLQLVCLLKSGGKWLLPSPLSVRASDFLRAREEWIKKGLAQLDFDGKLHPDRDFARTYYNIAQARAAQKYESGKETVYQLRGPVDILLIRSVEEGWELCLRPPLEGLLWVVPLKEQGRGRLTTLAVRDGRERLMETELSAARQLPRELIAHMTLFFGEE